VPVRFAPAKQKSSIIQSHNQIDGHERSKPHHVLKVRRRQPRAGFGSGIMFSKVIGKSYGHGYVMSKMFASSPCKNRSR
jgi:hypothetical protein